jgi:hypothetical protein
MPIGVEDRRHLGKLRRDQTHSLLRYTCNVDLDVEDVVRAPLRDDAAGSQVQILKPLKDTRESARVGFGSHAEMENLPIGRHESASWYALEEKPTQHRPAPERPGR